MYIPVHYAVSFSVYIQTIMNKYTGHCQVVNYTCDCKTFFRKKKILKYMFSFKFLAKTDFNLCIF